MEVKSGLLSQRSTNTTKKKSVEIPSVSSPKENNYNFSAYGMIASFEGVKKKCDKHKIQRTKQCQS